MDAVVVGYYSLQLLHGQCDVRKCNSNFLLLNGMRSFMGTAEYVPIQ